MIQRAVYRQLTARPVLVVRKPASRLFHSTPGRLSEIQKTIVTDHSLPPNDVQARRQSVGKASLTDLFSLKERTVVITGAGRGLGITLASAVLDAGGDVVCLDVLSEPSELEWAAITKLAEETGRHAKYYQCDITKEDDVQCILATAGSQAEKRSKPVRGMINCAGVQQMVDAIDYPVDGFKRIMDINVTGSFVVAKHTARLMREAKNSGSIVFIASMSGQIANRVRVKFYHENSHLKYSLRDHHLQVSRESTVRHTTPPRLQYSKCAVLYPRNGDDMVSASTACRLAISAPQ